MPTICFYCRAETDSMLDGKVCCYDCAELVRCASCHDETHRYDCEWFGPDPVCPECLQDVVDELVDPDWEPGEN